MFSTRKLILFAAITLAFSASIFAQDGLFNDPNVDYSFSLPDGGWKMISKPSATSPNVEYVYNDRREAYLTIRKLTIERNAFMTDAIRDEEQKLQFLPGYVAGKEENFAGSLKGNVFNYEYVNAGRNMSGRFYFLRAGDTTIYLLRFTGQRERLKSIRNQTDSIARTFQIKNG